MITSNFFFFVCSWKGSQGSCPGKCVYVPVIMSHKVWQLNLEIPPYELNEEENKLIIG